MLNQRYSKARQNPRAHPTGSSSATSPTVENNSERDEAPSSQTRKALPSLDISALRSPSVAPAPKSLLPAAVVVKTGHPLLASATVETLPASAAVETLPASAVVDTIPVASLVVVSTTVTEESWDILSMRAWRNFLGGPMPHLAFTVKAAQMQPMSSNVTSNVK
nr:hypothetical protein Iba_chr04dCG13570 [Ipomoea batatas]